jgi:RNA polymerase sigma factor (sigma-70 family)
LESDTSFADLMARLQAGDQDAAAQIFERFASRLIALARSRMGQRMRQKEDPEDVVQSVYQSFFVRQARGEFELRDWDSLWALLATITLRKCGHRIEHFQAARRDMRREIAPDTREVLTMSWQGIAREPTPQEAAVLAELLEQTMRGLEGYQRQILELSLQGHSVAEISTRVGYTQRTVQRILQRVRSDLERQRGSEL